MPRGSEPLAYSLFFQGIADYMPERPAARRPCNTRTKSALMPQAFYRREDWRIEY